MTLLGVDVGGTNMRVAAVGADGGILARGAALTRPERGGAATVEALADLIDDVLRCVATPPTRLGVAITGPVDRQAGIVNNPYTLPGWGPTDVVSPLRKRFALPVALENDANAAALGEWWQGAGRGSHRLATVTIGTGIGVGLLIDGQVQRKADGCHGEAGHHVLDSSGPLCYCGARGCWEVLAAGPALTRMAIEVVPSPEGRLRDASAADPPAHVADLVIEAALAGDAQAVGLVERVARWVGIGLVNTVAFFTPDVIVLGGGVGTRCFALLAPTIRRTLEEHGRLIPTDVVLLPAQTGDNAGVLGAALLTLNDSLDS